VNKHAVSIKWSDEDKGFIASVPGIPSLSAFGPTREEALSQLNIAAQVYFEVLEEAGKPLPHPETISTYSGQLRLRMPKSLHASLSIEAESEGVSLNTYLVTLLSGGHLARMLLKKNNIQESSFDKTRSGGTSGYIDSVRSSQGIEEARKKYQKKRSS
jgi:predicted RNase H-like HicB family nuclease